MGLYVVGRTVSLTPEEKSLLLLENRDDAHRFGLDQENYGLLLDIIPGGGSSGAGAGFVDARDFSGTGSDTIFNTTAQLQAAIDYARSIGATLLLPPGNIELEDTLKLGYGDLTDPFLTAQVRIRGAGAYQTIIHSNHNDRPAVNIQASPFAFLEDFTVTGLNDFSHHVSYYPLRDIEEYFAAGITDHRYKPYAGVTLNAYSGTVAAENRYPNDPYGRHSGGYMELHRMHISGFVAGICINPNGSNSGLGNGVLVNRCLVDFNTYCFSTCDANARNFTLTNCVAGASYCILTNNTHGLRGGFPPTVIGGEWNSTYRWFDMTPSVAGMLIEGVSGEEVQQLGVWGSGGTNPLALKSCSLYFGATQGPEAGKEAVHLVGGGPIGFSGSVACLDSNPGVFNLNGDASMAFDGALFTKEPNPTKDWKIAVQGQPFGGLPKYERVQSIGLGVGHDGRGVFTDTAVAIYNVYVPKRVCLRSNLTAVTVLSPDPTNDPIYLRATTCNPGFVFTSSIAGPTFYDETETIVFSTTFPGECRVGDQLLWKLKDDAPGLYTSNGATLTNVPIVALVVTAINDTYNQVTCAAIFDYADLDQAWEHGSRAYIVPDQWAPGTEFSQSFTFTPFTGTWLNASNSVTLSVNADNMLRVGDFIKADNGLPDLVRVDAVSGTTITLSKNSTSARTAERLYFGKLELA